MGNIGDSRRFSFLIFGERQRLECLKTQRTLTSLEKKELQSLLSRHKRETVANRRLAGGDLRGLVNELNSFAIEKYRGMGGIYG